MNLKNNFFNVKSLPLKKIIDIKREKKIDSKIASKKIVKNIG
jgi:hypothetical protein